MILSKKSFLKRFIATCVVIFMSADALAHDIYIWPSYFTLNSQKPTSVPVDVTASHTTFRPDFSMSSAGVEIYGIDGKKIRRRGNYFEGARRATFDLEVKEQGTYMLKYVSKPSYFTRYQIGRNDDKKNMRATKSEAKKRLSKKAKQVETSRYSTVAMSFVSNMAPTTAVFTPTNTGFELIPKTHPADYVTSEDIVIQLLFDGNPVAGLDVVVEQEGVNYKPQPIVLDVTSDKDGLVTFSLNEGGRYMLKVNHQQDSDDPEADILVSRVYYAFEAIYE